MQQYSLWSQAEIETRAILSMVEKDELALAGHHQALKRPIEALQDTLKNKQYLVGERFTVADLNVAAVMEWAKRGGFDFTPYPAVEDWLQKCLSRPAKETLGKSKL